jgi:putative tricarboxylic transport membrane protein
MSTGPGASGGAGQVEPAPPDTPGSGETPLPSQHEEGPRAGPAVRLAGGLVPLAFGVAALVLAWRMRMGEPRDPGPGMWPAIISVAIIALSVVLLVRERDERDYERFSRGAWFNLLGVASLVAYVLLFRLVGFEVATLVVTAVWLKLLGGESWRTTIVLSALLTASLYTLFVLVLDAPIPRLLIL